MPDASVHWKSAWHLIRENPPVFPQHIEERTIPQGIPPLSGEPFLLIRLQDCHVHGRRRVASLHACECSGYSQLIYLSCLQFGKEDIPIHLREFHQLFGRCRKLVRCDCTEHTLLTISSLHLTLLGRLHRVYVTYDTEWRLASVQHLH